MLERKPLFKIIKKKKKLNECGCDWNPHSANTLLWASER